MDKKRSRLRRALRARSRIKQLAVVRLTVHRTMRHIYAQLIGHDHRVLASASTLDKEVKQVCGYSGNVKAATVVGEYIAKRGQKCGVDRVAFDRSGFQYHGRVKALADAAREHGLLF